MNNTILTIFILISNSLYSQFVFEINSRSAKVDTVFDYLVGLGITDTIFKEIEASVFGSLEREQGTKYYQYRGSFNYKYGKLSHITDTEKDIRITSCNMFVSKSIISLGIDLSYTDNFLYGAYLSLKHKFISVETAFNGEFYKFQYIINPKKSITDKLKIGVIIKGIFIEQTYKWRNGFTIEYTF